MKTILSALVALSFVAGAVAPVAAAELLDQDSSTRTTVAATTTVAAH